MVYVFLLEAGIYYFENYYEWAQNNMNQVCCFLSTQTCIYTHIETCVCEYTSCLNHSIGFDLNDTLKIIFPTSKINIGIYVYV